MTESWTPPRGIDPDRPSPARVYDCYLGGTHNFAADRAVAAQAIAAMPQLPDIMRANRAFLRRAVRMVAREGVDLDEIQRRIENPVAKLILEGRFGPKDVIPVTRPPSMSSTLRPRSRYSASPVRRRYVAAAG